MKYIADRAERYVRVMPRRLKAIRERVKAEAEAHRKARRAKKALVVIGNIHENLEIIKGA